MTEISPRQSAKIYQFPVGGRAALKRSSEEASITEAVAPEQAPAIVYGSGWYHDAAVQEAAEGRVSARD